VTTRLSPEHFRGKYRWAAGGCQDGAGLRGARGRHTLSGAAARATRDRAHSARYRFDEPRFDDERFRPLEELDLLGTFAPFLRASDNPIAIACLRLVTLPP
jgi:hypothetical protein